MTGIFRGFFKRLIISALLIAFSSTVLLSQKSLSDTLSQAKSHVSVIGVDRVTVDDRTGFALNDTVLLIQMQGVQIIIDNGSYGGVSGKFGEPGMHEFLIVQSVNPGSGTTGEIVFRNNILNAYNVTGNVQIVRVPYFNSATVTGRLFCSKWNPSKKSGGVLALIVAKTLTLNADIDVSGLGFRGGKDTIGDGICWNTNSALYGLEYYPRSFRNAGFKGEGVANFSEFNQPLGSNFMKGLGNNWTGGGGGNGRYSGGGGGSNRGAGGHGAFEDCFPAKAGGNGGLIAVHAPSLVNRIYMGGGGGASTSSPTGAMSNGGNGGGIVIIVADAIAGNNGNILADGVNGVNKTGLGGSGGGGAGGSIALSLNSYGSSAITFSAKGGNGGSNPNDYGEGGGGGGGLLYLSTNTSANVTAALGGGLQGNDGGSASSGTIGEKQLGFTAVLNGFLFNSIYSSVSGNQVDAICSNMLPKKIIGTKPVGGTGPYTYLWEKSYNQSTWIPLTNDPDPVNYTPTVVETATVWYRRTITDSSPTPLVDISKPVQIVVQPFIKNNIVGNSDTICYAQNPVALTSKATLQDGNGIYSFKWQVSQNNLTFNLPLNSYTAEGYTPPAGLTTTSWYRRTVTSGKCIDSSAVAKITVLPVITGNNITNAPPDICYGGSFVNITASSPPTLSGGDLTYRISWESSLTGITGWSLAAGAIIAGGFNPAESSPSFPGSLYYRRVVKSGSNDVCVDNSAPLKLNDYPVIVNNAVKTNSINKPICSGSAAPRLIDSLTVSGGNNTYAYSWEYRTGTVPWTAVNGATSSDYLPGVLDVTTDFRRKVISSACISFSNILTITAHSPVLNNNVSLLSAGSDTTLCNGGNPYRLVGSVPTGGINSYTYLWLSSIDNSTWNQIPTATLRDYDPPTLTVPTYYKRQVISGACLVVSSSTVNINILPLISNNTISGDASVCKNLAPAIVKGAALSGGGGSGSYTYLWQESIDGGLTWKSASAVNNTPDYQPPALTVPVKYRRFVTSGLKNTCQSTSNIYDISIDPLPVSQIDAGKDDQIFSIRKEYQLNAVAPVTGETGIWTPLTDGIKLSDPNSSKTLADHLSSGKNVIVWTVERKPCKLSDTVNIVVNDDRFPQGFSPNGDTYNNEFIIEGLDPDLNFVDLKIINGAGTEVYRTSNRNGQTALSWDGKNQKGIELPEGTYYYMLKLTSRGGKGNTTKSGFIILKRY